MGVLVASVKLLLFTFWRTAVSAVAELAMGAYPRLRPLVLCLLCFLVATILSARAVLDVRSRLVQALQVVIDSNSVFPFVKAVNGLVIATLLGVIAQCA